MQDCAINWLNWSDQNWNDGTFLIALHLDSLNAENSLTISTLQPRVDYLLSPLIIIYFHIHALANLVFKNSIRTPYCIVKISIAQY